jgi:hypothetical protein
VVTCKPAKRVHDHRIERGADRGRDVQYAEEGRRSWSEAGQFYPGGRLANFAGGPTRQVAPPAVEYVNHRRHSCASTLDSCLIQPLLVYRAVALRMKKDRQKKRWTAGGVANDKNKPRRREASLPVRSDSRVALPSRRGRSLLDAHLSPAYRSTRKVVGSPPIDKW